MFRDSSSHHRLSSRGSLWKRLSSQMRPETQAVLPRTRCFVSACQCSCIRAHWAQEKIPPSSPRASRTRLYQLPKGAFLAISADRKTRRQERSDRCAGVRTLSCIPQLVVAVPKHASNAQGLAQSMWHVIRGRKRCIGDRGGRGSSRWDSRRGVGSKSRAERQ